MMNNYLFETYRGQFNWNKLTRKGVHLVGLSHVHVARCTVQGTYNFVHNSHLPMRSALLSTRLTLT